MKKIGRQCVGVFFIALWVVNVQAQENIKMEIGDISVIPIEKIARVAVGDSKVINASPEEDKSLILFARSTGTTRVEVWNQKGERKSFDVAVTSAQQRAVQEDIRRMLNRISHVKASIVGDKIIVEGERLTDADREKIHKLAAHYPDIIDMTSQVGWDEMVMLDVKIVELPRNYLQEIGMQWGVQGGMALGGALEKTSAHLLSRPIKGVVENTLGKSAGYVGLNTLLNANIQLMARQGKAVVLAQPQLMARSGATAEFLAGGEVPYSVVDDKGNTQTIFKPYGVSLLMTPRIEKNGTIRSKINVEVSAVDASLTLSGGPALKTRRTSTEFNVRSGEPLVLSGFISRDQVQGMEKMPGIGDVPILGELFRSKKFQSNETELVIIVRPVIVSSQNPQMHTRIQRTQAIIESSFEEGAIINVDISSEKGNMGIDPYRPKINDRLNKEMAHRLSYGKINEGLDKKFKIEPYRPKINYRSNKKNSYLLRPIF